MIAQGAANRPLSIAHRGASAYARANTLQAFRFAHVLGADMWEVDLRMTADGEIVAFHDATLADGCAIAELHQDEIDGDIPRFSEVVALARELGAGIYADIKVLEAAEPACAALTKAELERVILGAFDLSVVKRLGEIGAPYPRALLVPVGGDPFALAGEAEIIHLCWERMDRPQDLLDAAFFRRCEAAGKQVVLWHEEDRQRMEVLRKLPFWGFVPTSRNW